MLGFQSPNYPAASAIFVLFLFTVIVLIALARPLLAGFALVLLGLPAYHVLAARQVISVRVWEEDR